jgi:lamin B
MTPAGGRRGTPLRASKKRRYEEESVETAAEFDTSSTVNGDVEILEDDPEGKFIRLLNKGEKVCLFTILCI